MLGEVNASSKFYCRTIIIVSSQKGRATHPGKQLVEANDGFDRRKSLIGEEALGIGCR
jgi:hypothetical protein